MTSYIVLAKDGDHWLEVGHYEARSAQSAIRAEVDREPASGQIYVAIPARSWKPVTVKVETKTQLKFS